MRGTTDLRGDKIIDSRDLIARLDTLTSERETLLEAITEKEEEFREWTEERAEAPTEEQEQEDTERKDELDEEIRAAKQALEDWDDSDEGEEYQQVKSLVEECEGYGDFKHGETLIRDDYFTEYAEQLAEDLGYMEDADRWPFTHINWEMAADELKQDYMSVELGGFTYWMRA